MIEILHTVALWSFGVSLLCLAWWSVVCLRTRTQRNAIIDAAYSDFEREKDWLQFSKTDRYFNRHLFRVATLRDPWVIYPPDLVAAAKAGAKPWFKSEEGQAAYAQHLALHVIDDHLYNADDSRRLH